MSEHYADDLYDDDYIDDIEDVGIEGFSDASVTGTDWTTETIIRQVSKGNIILSPSFQRRDAWTQERKSLFIESLMLNLPVPQLVLAESPHSKGKFIVLDGKQRLLSILQFAGVDLRDTFPEFKLKGLPVLSKLNGKTFGDLIEDNEDLSAFENYTIRTSVVKNCPNEEVLYQIFYRLNTGSLPLSPQELRFALKPGEFSEFLDSTSAQLEVFKYIFNDKKPDFRMRDAELLLRHLANKFFIVEYSGNLKKFLDESYQKFADSFEAYSYGLHHEIKQLDDAHCFLVEAFGEDLYKKWKNGKFESRFNRSVFEVMAYIFSYPHVRDNVRSRIQDIKHVFVQKMAEDHSFLAYFESTTKSVEAVSNRFSLTAELFNDKLGADAPVVKIARG